MASLGNLSSSVAHELNNPLEGILTFAKLLHKRIGKTSLPQETITTFQEELKLIADEAQRCGTIVKNLLVFSRHRGVEFQTVRFREILARCALLVNHHAEMNGVTIHTTCTEDDEVECDPGQVQQVLLALMVNAVEAMAPGPDRTSGGTLTVDVSRDRAGGALVIRVSDTGTGISDEDRPHIFEPFFTTKSEGKGVGLGLAISYGIIQRHHGSIEVESSIGQGTVFVITLPVRPPRDNEAHSTSAPVEGAHP
jgi:two-component system NtrC family sensor kinase